MMHLAVAALLSLAQTNDKAQANGYDDAWKSGWRTHCMSVLGGGTKTDGFVIHVGDSITYSSAYGAWMKSGAGKTSEDTAVTTNWINAFSVPAGVDPTSHHGLYLANVDIPGGGKSMTAAGGIGTDEYLSGSNNGTLPAMPATTVTATGQAYVASTSYPSNLQIDSVAAAFAQAQVAVVMLGTNDCTAGRTASAFAADLQSIVAKLEFQHIAVVLSTIPPHSSNNALAQQYNTQIRSYAQSHGLPLIDFYAEILARQPVNYATTLMTPGDVHPSGDRAGYTVGSDPYADGGDPLTHKTGAAAAEVGYLLRSWLTAQKLKEVRSFVVDGNPAVVANPTPAPPSPTPPPTPTPTASTKSGGGGGGGKCGGSVAGPVSPFTLLGAAIAALLLARAARKTGF